MSETQEIQTAEVERDFGTKACRTTRVSQAVRTGLAEPGDLSAQTDTQVIPVGFIEVIQNIFERGIAVRFFDCGVDTRKNAQIVERSLDISFPHGRKRIARFHGDSQVDHALTGGPQSRSKHVAYELFLAFRNRIN